VQASFSLFLALRFLRPKRTFVSVITIISLLGVMLGVAVPVIALSVMTGFDHALQRAILGFEPHLKVVNGDVMTNWRELLPKVEKVPGVEAVAPYVQGPVLVEHDGRVNQAMVRGIDVEQEEKLIDLKKFIIGTVDMPLDSVIIGKELAAELGVRIGDEVIIYAPGDMKALIDELHRQTEDPNAKSKTVAELKQDIVIPAPLKVVGLLNSGTYTFDSSFMLVPLANGQELYGLKDGVQGLAVKTNDPYKVRPIQNRVNEAIDGDGYAISWYDENRERFEAISMEKQVIFILLSVTGLVAGFSIMNTFITVTVQKTREIGIMKALGATRPQIVWVFLSQGMIVGVLGTIAGLGLSLFMLHYRNDFRDWLNHTFHLSIFPPGIYEFNGIPAEVLPSDLVIICVGAFFLCSIATFVPAWIAAGLDPVKALRTD
jgi:lipoprotein-releasing system permease protein